MGHVDVTPRRRPLASERTFVAMVWVAVGMWVLALPAAMGGNYFGALALVGYGLQLALVALLPLLWALVRSRGRVLPMVWGTAVAVFGTAAVAQVIGAVSG